MLWDLTLTDIVPLSTIPSIRKSPPAWRVYDTIPSICPTSGEKKQVDRHGDDDDFVSMRTDVGGWRGVRESGLLVFVIGGHKERHEHEYGGLV
jgi:hypothetical protein